jgi:FixJ family two-component response regulator
VTVQPIIHIVDDDRTYRFAIARLLSAFGYQIALYSSGAEWLEKSLKGEPGCILLDVKMPGLSGPQLQGRLAKLGNTLPVIFMTGYGDIPTSVRAIKAGAEDFLTKPVPKDDLLAAIERALIRFEKMHEYDSRIAALRSLVTGLTPRQGDVFALLVRGKLNKQIAYELGTCERTIKAHRQQIMEKCEARSVADLVLIAERLGMLSSLIEPGLDSTNTDIRSAAVPSSGPFPRRQEQSQWSL